MREISNEALLYWPSDSETNVSRLMLGITVKTERSRLIGIYYTYGIFSKNDNNIVQMENLYFALPVLRAHK